MRNWEKHDNAANSVYSCRGEKQYFIEILMLIAYIVNPHEKGMKGKVLFP